MKGPWIDPDYAAFAADRYRERVAKERALRALFTERITLAMHDEIKRVLLVFGDKPKKRRLVRSRRR